MTQKLQEPRIKIRSGGSLAVFPSTILHCLDPGKLLNDEAVNGYAQLVEDTAQPDIIVLNSFFCYKAARGDDIRRLWKKVSLSYLFCSSVTSDYTASSKEE